MKREPRVSRIRPARRRAGTGKGSDAAPGAAGPRREPTAERLQQVLDRAELVIAETRRVIRNLLRDLQRQAAASRPVLPGQPVAPRRPRRARPRRGERPRP